jgi:dihydroflavonol-4-reductase
MGINSYLCTMNKVLVTGATGLVGSFIVKELLANNLQVRVLCRSTASLQALASVKDQIEIATGDILDVFSLADALADVQYVVHCAALVSYSPGDRQKLHLVNVEGTANVVNIALDLGIKKLAYISSIAAIGKKSEEPNQTVNEANEWNPANIASNYAHSKYLAETEVFRGIAEGLPAVIINPSVVLGESDWNRSSGRLFKYVFDKNLFYTPGQLSVVDAADVAKATVLLLQSDISDERFILSATQLPIKTLFAQIAQRFGVRAPNVQLGGFFSALLWRFELLRSFFTNSQPLITKETAQSAQKSYLYDGTAVTKAVAFQYLPLEVSLDRICRNMLSFNQLKKNS